MLGGEEMKKDFVVLALALALAAVPGWALAGTVEGTVQGFTCITAGKVCPVGKEDPVIATEKIFVILTSSARRKIHFAIFFQTWICFIGF